MTTLAAEHDERPSAAGQLEESWLLLATFYGVIVAGTVPVAVAELSPLYTLLAAFLCVTHALVVGTGGRPLLSDQVCGLLSVGALLYALVEALFFGVHISYSLAHFLVLVQLVLIYGPHRMRELRLIPVVSLFELMVAGIWALDLVYLPAFVLSAGAVMANFLAIDMHWDGGPGPRGPAFPPAERRVARRDFVAALWLPALAVFLVTALLFPLLPRFGGLSRGRSLSQGMMTGFSQNVSLREVGLLRQSDRVALRVQFFRQDAQQRVKVRPGHILMRGTSLPLYRRGQWFGYDQAMRAGLNVPFVQTPLGSTYFSSQDIYELRNVDVPRQLILQKVQLEERPGRILFALYRPLQLDAGPPYELARGRTSHDLINPVTFLEDNAYQVLSLVPRFSPQQLREAGTPRPAPPWLAFWEVPEQLRPVLEQVKQEVESLYHPKTDYDRVVACVGYLVSSSRFTYTLELPEYGEQDPVAAFLTNTRRGSCEQFSSALALMVRMWSIPSRLVVGYKDGVYDPAEESYVFRDMDAHAWVEVYFNDLGWVEFDPTPGSASSLMQGQPAHSALPGLVERLRRAVSGLFYRANTHWNVNVIGYGRDQQQAFLRDLSAAARGLAQDASSVLRALWPGLPNLGFLQVALVVVAVTFVGIGLFLFAGWLDRAMRRRRRARQGPTVRFYEELLAILRRKGLRRPLHQTPREFAHAAAARLGPGDGEVERAVNLVTDLYYRARYGGYELDARQESEMRQALHKLKAIPRPRRGAGQWPAPA